MGVLHLFSSHASGQYDAVRHVDPNARPGPGSTANTTATNQSRITSLENQVKQLHEDQRRCEENKKQNLAALDAQIAATEKTIRGLEIQIRQDQEAERALIRKGNSKSEIDFQRPYWQGHVKSLEGTRQALEQLKTQRRKDSFDTSCSKITDEINRLNGQINSLRTGMVINSIQSGGSPSGKSSPSTSPAMGEAPWGSGTNPYAVSPTNLGLPPQPGATVYETEKQREERLARGGGLNSGYGDLRFENYVQDFINNRNNSGNPLPPDFFDKDPAIVSYDSEGNGIDAWGYVVEYPSEAARRAAIIEARAEARGPARARRSDLPPGSLAPFTTDEASAKGASSSSKPPGWKPHIPSQETVLWMKNVDEMSAIWERDKDAWIFLAETDRTMTLVGINESEQKGLIGKEAAQKRRTEVENAPNTAESDFWNRFNAHWRQVKEEMFPKPTGGGSSSPADKIQP